MMLYVNTMMKKLWNSIRQFYQEEDGVAVLELILIIVVLIGLVLIFKNQLTTIVNNIFDTISSRSKGF